MFTSAILLTLIIDYECTYISCLFTGWRQEVVWHPASILLTHCLYVLYCSYHVFSTLGLLNNFRPYIWPQTSFSIKIIQIIIFQVCLHKLRAADIEFLMPAWQQYLRHRKLPIAENLVSKSVTLGMLKIFVKELDIVASEFDPEPYYWLWQDCISKPWQWLEER